MADFESMQRVLRCKSKHQGEEVFMRNPLGIWILSCVCFASMQALAMDKPQQGQKDMYPLSEVRGETPSKVALSVEVNVSPVLDYDLPRVPLSFRLNIVNRSTETLHIASPVQPLILRFNAPDSHLIEVPRNVVGPSIRPVQKGSTAAIVFRKANENGKEVTVEPTAYQIAPGAFLEITIETDSVISERILAALEKSKDKFVDVTVTMPVINLRVTGDYPVMRSERIRLPIPKPEG